MRLIDAGNLKKVMTEDWFLEILASQNSKDGCKKVIENCIDSIPLDYDIEKVVEQLERQIKQYHARAGQYGKRGAEIECRRMFSKACSYEHAIEIVKRGGVNDD